MTKNWKATVGILALGLAASLMPRAALAQSGEGWTTLVDGKSLGEFSQTGEANWRVEDGAVVADKGKGGHLVSKDSYKDFQVYAEFWIDENANTGIFIRCDPKAIGSKTCYEFNIWDKRPDQSYGTGAIVNFAEVNPMPKAAGQWNKMEITAKGRQLTFTLNGQKTADVRNAMFEEGHVTLQYGGGVVKFRKVAIKPL